MSGTATSPVADAGGTTQMYSALVVPTSAVGEDYPVFAIPIDGDPLPFNDLVAGRLQHAFSEGCAVYLLATDEALLHRVLHVVQMLADSGEGSTAQ